jgi:hypothetical protein
MGFTALRSWRLLLLAILIPDELLSQVQSGLAVGDRVRYWESRSGRAIRATLVGARNDTLLLRLATDSLVYVPRAQLVRLDVSTGWHRSPGLGALAGLGAGVLVGSVGGAMSGRKAGICQCVDRGKNAGAGALIGGLAGMVAGTVVGVPRENWKAVDLLSLRQTTPLTSGSGPRLRLTYTSAGLTSQAVGTLHSASGDSVVLQDAQTGHLVTVPRYAIRSSELSLGTRRHNRAGLVIGLVGGAALSSGISALVQAPKSHSGESYHDLNIVFAGFLGALGGSILGAEIGSHITTESWTTFVVPARRDPPPELRH